MSIFSSVAYFLVGVVLIYVSYTSRTPLYANLIFKFCGVTVLFVDGRRVVTRMLRRK